MNMWWWKWWWWWWWFPNFVIMFIRDRGGGHKSHQGSATEQWFWKVRMGQVTWPVGFPRNNRWIVQVGDMQELARYQKWPYLKGATFSKPSFWVSMLVFGGVLHLIQTLNICKRLYVLRGVQAAHIAWCVEKNICNKPYTTFTMLLLSTG